MLSALLPALLFSGAAQAQAFSVSPSAVMLGVQTLEIRPGLRLGYEPSPNLVLEAFGDYGQRGIDVAGAISGRAWLVGDGTTGAYVSGRGAIGMSSWNTYQQMKLGPLVGVYGGFGGRPASWLNLEAMVGPEIAGGGSRLRTEMTASIVFNLDAGSGNVRHRPTRKVR